MLKGEYSPSLLFSVPALMVFVTLIVIYAQSQYYDHQKPFPQCWISACAAHYPQYVWFRIATISGSALILLGWFTNGLFLKTLCREQTIRLASIHITIPTITGMMGAMLLMGSTANIDTGKRNGKWHTSCASAFFIFTLVALIYNTVVGWLIHTRAKGAKHVINKFVLYFKTALVAAIIFQFYLSSVYGSEHHMDIILQWTLTATVLLGFYAISLDMRPFKYIYTEVSNSQANISA